MVERGGLENRCGALRYREFESLPLRSSFLKSVGRGAGVAELARLESVCAGNCTVGSNPTLSAKDKIF